MGFWNLRRVFTDRLSQTPPGFSRVKCDDFDQESSPLPPRESSLLGLSTLKLSLFALLYASLTSALTCLVIWRFGFDSNVVSRAKANRLLQSPIPDFPKEIRTFEENSTFTDPPTAENNEAWNSLLPSGRGFVFVKDAAKYGLEPGIDTGRGEIYSVSLYHQIHCLGLVRKNYWRVVNGIVNADAEITEFARSELSGSHTAHCFDYFRQSFECSADMSLEWTQPGSKQVDGVGIPHVCTSKRAVKEYMDKHQFDGAHNHDISA
ncbi:hypothetical protein QQS21_012737 [Conoideocrella luteorostrata]|uniref:Uncharacterized protein n=1 Tax=Conoideocrella luteorostrata TaxID=1105319 RepID=A0AAJ0FME6_9HYPO|nr:hypothetical protein QQS21_012737 [Conoideocrella luteorostrata]